MYKNALCKQLFLRWSTLQEFKLKASNPEYFCLTCVQDIDGQALLLLTLPTVQECMDLKLGPAIKLCHQIERVKVAFYKQYANWWRSSDRSKPGNVGLRGFPNYFGSRLLCISTHRGTAGGCFQMRSWRINFWDTICVKMICSTHEKQKNFLTVDSGRTEHTELICVLYWSVKKLRTCFFFLLLFISIWFVIEEHHSN